MKQALQQLTAGFIYSIMAVSLILGPIPKTNVVWASESNCYKEGDSDSEDRVYTAGCDMGEVVQKAQLNKYTGHQSSFAAMMEQGVAGMMAVVLLQALRYKYLHEHDETKLIYGNDCSVNKTGQWTIRIAQLGALAYLIGDIKANMTFQEASKKAADSYATNPGNLATEQEVELDESGEKITAAENQQLQSFEKLIEVFGDQEKALKAKMVLSGIAEGAFLAAGGLELAGMSKCNSLCETNKEISDGKWEAFQRALDTAEQAIKADTANNTSLPGPPPNSLCLTPVTIALNAFKANALRAKHGGDANDAAYTVAKKKTNKSEEVFWAFNVLAKVKSFFGGDKIKGETVTEASKEAAEKAAMEGANKAKEILGMPIEKKDDVAAAGDTGKRQGNLKTKEGSDAGTIASVVTSATLCTTSRPVLAEALGSYIDYAYTPIECCGGPGHTELEQTELSTAKQILLGKASALFGTVQATTKAKEAIVLGSKEAARKLLEESSKKAMAKMTKEFSSVGKLLKHEASGTSISLANGTLPGFGVPKVSEFNGRKDIRIMGLFEGLDLFKKQSSLEDTKFYIKKNFESIVRRFAMIAQLDSFDGKKPELELKQIADLEQRINHTMFFVDRLIDETVTSGSLEELAFKDFQENDNWKTVVNMIGGLVMPNAHASFLGGMAKGIAISAGLQILQKQLGTKGPWDEILNIGSQFMMLSGILGKYGQSWGFVKPKGRAYTWGAMALVNAAVLMLDNSAKKKVQEYKKITIQEKERYKEAIGLGGANTYGSRDGSGELKLKDNASGVKYATGGSPVKSCAVPKGQGFAPAPCPSSVPTSTFQVPKPTGDLAKGVTPYHLNALGMVSNYSQGLATGSKGVSDLVGADLNKIQQGNAAMRAHNEKLMKKVDQMEQKANKNSKSKLTPLASLLAKAKSGLLSSSSAQGLASMSPDDFEATPFTAKEEEKEKSIGAVKSSVFGKSTGKPAATTGSDALDFGFDDMGGVETEEDREVAAKAEENLDDFVIQHDDINKQKDVSIFKILSNRYLLSYPKVLEEK